MNGRAYDYNLGRFLSVDPFIQAPGNSQSMNPYSYIMNNPLAGTDPSGYKWETVWDSRFHTLDQLKQVLTKLGFEVSNGYVHFNSKNTASWDSVEKIEGPDFSDELKVQVAKSAVTRRLAKLGIAISGSTSQEDINRIIGSITGNYEVSDSITEYGNTYDSISAVDSAVEADRDEMSSTDYSVNQLKILSGLNALAERQIAESSKGFSRARLAETRMYRNMEATQKEAFFWVGVGISPAAVALIPEGIAGYIGQQGLYSSAAIGRYGSQVYKNLQNRKALCHVIGLTVGLCNSGSSKLPEAVKGQVQDAASKIAARQKLKQQAEAARNIDNLIRNTPNKMK